MKRNKNKIRSSLSGKIINGREVILVEEAVEFVKKMGYIVKSIRSYNDKSFGTFLKETGKTFSIHSQLKVVILTLFSFLFIIPFVSAAPSLFVIDFSLRQNQLMLIILFSIAGTLYYFNQKLWSGFLVFLSGIIMAFNDFNIFVSLVIMGLGFAMFSQEGKS